MTYLKWLLLTPFTELGYYKLSIFLRKLTQRVFLPIPRAVCEGYLNALNLPSSYLRVWKPVLDLIWSGELSAECYSEPARVERQVDFAIKLASLVIKASAYGKVDVSEWISISSMADISPGVWDWRGLLVVDRFSEFVVMHKRGINVDRLLAVDVFVPTPIDLLVLIVKNILAWNCDLVNVIKWVIKYINELVVKSKDLTEAYIKLINDAEYRKLIRDCAAEEYTLYWWTI